MSLFQELKRRNVFRVAAAYIIVGWLILQVGEVLAPALLLPEWINSALAFFLILGFPIAVFFAWAYELTPEGLKKEKEVDRATSITSVTGRKLDFAIIALLLMALGYFAWDKFMLRGPAGDEFTQEAPAEESGPPSIAVLPLADMSPDGDHEYFSDGLTEELLNILAKIRELQVAGRTSSFAFKGQNQDLREIGRKLNVAHILEGSVRKDEANNRVRITLQLIDAESGFHLWSETYDRDLADIFAIQEEVAHEVADALRITLLGQDEERLDAIATTDLDAYDLFLRAREEQRKAGFVNLDRAQDLFQQSLALDPTFTPAKLGLAYTWARLAATGAIPTQTALDRGMPLLQTVLDQEPGNAWALGLMAYYLDGAGEPEQAERHYRDSLERDPRNAIVLKEYGRHLYDRGEIEQGLALIDSAVDIEPYDISVLFESCQTRAYLARYEAALVVCRRMQELEPDGVQGYYGEALAHMYQGDLPQVLLGYSRAIERDPEDFEMIAAMAIFWIALGDGEQARLWLDRAEAIGAGQPVPTNTRVLLNEFNERYDLAGNIAAQALARDMDDRHGTESFFRRANAQYAMRTGNWEAGLGPLREVVPWAFEPELTMPEDAIDFADDLLLVAALLRRADPLSARSGQLIDFIERHAADFHPARGAFTEDYRLAAVSALRGETSAALEHIEVYVDHMVLPYWRPFLLDHPAFFAIRDDDGFRERVRDIETLAERQRLEARELLGVDS